MTLDRRTLLAAGAALAGGGPTLAQQPDRYVALDTAMHGLVDQKKLAGVVTLVARKGKVRHQDAYGRLDASRPDRVQVDSIFRLASMTKPIIGVAMMMLWEEGRWTLDDPVAKHVPEFAGLKVRTPAGPVPQASPMTMRQLMSHTAGFGTLADYENAGLRDGDLKDMVAKLGTMPLYSQPGTDWAYGPAVDIQGHVIERLSGQGLDAFLKARVFEPLAMVDTGFWVEPAKATRVARIHTYAADGTIMPAPGAAATPPTSRPRFLSGGGGLLGTAPDYWRFCQMVLDGGVLGGRRLLKPSTVKLMRTNVLAPGVEVDLYRKDAVGQGFGMDFAIVQDPAAAKTAKPAGTFYWGGAFGTWFWIDPVSETILIGMIQNLRGSIPGAGTPDVRELSARAIYA